MNSAQQTFERRDPRKLKPFHLAAQFERSIDDGFLESCDRGIDSPLLILADDTVISGHRRLKAALHLGKSEVPVIVRRDWSDPLVAELKFYETNQQEGWTTEQKLRVYARVKDILSVQAAQRQKVTQRCGAVPVVDVVPPPENIGEKGKSRDEAARQSNVGMSGKLADKGVAVLDAIDAAKSAGDTERAADLRDTLNNQSVAAAHRKATESVDEPALAATGTPTSKTVDQLIAAGNREANRVMQAYNDAFKLAAEFAKTPEGAFLAGNRLEELRGKTENCKGVLSAVKPYAACPYCHGAKCRHCAESGVVPRVVYQSARKN